MMQKGVYYIGDLCYVLDDVWDEVCSNLEDGEHVLKDGRKYAIYSTMYGDGVYTSNIGTNHPVDSGTIGVIKLSGTSVCCQKGLGAVVEFKNDFLTHSDDGKIVFGHVEINTGYDDEDEDEDDCFNWDDDDYDDCDDDFDDERKD